MATIASKIQWTTAAFAVAAAATLVPVAFADPTDPEAGDTGGAAVGSSAGQAPTRSTRKDRSRVNDDAVAAQGSNGSSGTSTPGGSESPSETPDATAGGRASTNVTTPSANATPPQVVGEEFTIIGTDLVADPELQDATFGWLENLDLDVCALGLSQSIRGSQNPSYGTVVGPYATSTLAFKTDGCG